MRVGLYYFNEQNKAHYKKSMDNFLHIIIIKNNEMGLDELRSILFKCKK